MRTFRTLATLLFPLAVLSPGAWCGEPDRIQDYLRRLACPKFSERQAAAKALEQLGKPALSALRKLAFQHSNLEVRRRAEQLVETIENRLYGQLRIGLDDERLFLAMFKEFLFDPRGCAYVEEPVDIPDWTTGYVQQFRHGWLAKNGTGKQVFFIDGENMPAPPANQIKKIDFLEDCCRLYAKNNGLPLLPIPFYYSEARPSREGGSKAPNLVLAAWLYRLGRMDLAAQALAVTPPDRRAELLEVRRWLAEMTLARMIHYFGRHQDDLVLAHGERLYRLYPAEARALPRAAAIVADLKRRQAQGLLGKKPSPDLPASYSSWNRDKQLTYLLGKLDETTDDLLPWVVAEDSVVLPSVSGEEPSPLILALVKIGEAAVPALLDVLEKDERLTRAVAEEPRPIGSVRSVRDVALAVLRKILRVDYLDPRDPDKDDWINVYLGGLPVKDFNRFSGAARAYWKEFGPLSYERRMIRVLSDSRSTLSASCEAMLRLTGIRRTDRGPLYVNKGELGPAILRLSKPTAAEAILAALDRELSSSRSPEQLDRIFDEPLYFSALIRLGDPRIVPRLAERATKETDVQTRLHWVYAAYRLADARPFDAFARELAAGKVNFSEDDALWVHEFASLVEYLAGVKRPTSGLCYARYLRRLMGDKTLTSLSYKVEKGYFYCLGIGFTYSTSALPAVLANRALRNATVRIRRCDLAGEWCKAIAGMPAYHPLLQDSEQRLGDMIKALDDFRGSYRVMTAAEKEALTGEDSDAPSFIPAISPLHRSARIDDVAAGKAIFHLDGKGKLADMKLPARGKWRQPGTPKTICPCLIVQAEVRPDGEVICGIIESYGIRAVPANQLTEIMPLATAKVR